MKKGIALSVGITLLLSLCLYAEAVLQAAKVQEETTDGYHYSVIVNPKAVAPADYKFKDGVYEASLPYFGQGRYDAHVKITIKDGLIVEVLFWEQQQRGVVGKGKGYIEQEVRSWGESNRADVTAAVAEAAQYPAKLIATQDIDKVDVSSSASYSFRRFVPVVKKALETAIIKK